MDPNTPPIDIHADDGQEIPPKLHGRPWLGIQFDCCGAYARVYRNAQGTAYVGWCPGCQRRVRLRVGPSGTQDRFFRAS